MCIKEKFSKNLLKKNKGVPFQVSQPKKIQNLIVQSYLRQKGLYSKQLSLNMKSLLSGKITKDEFMKSSKDLMSGVYAESYKLGKYYGSNKYADLDDNERRFIVYQTTKELKFLDNFANDMVNGSGKMPYKRRMKMYVDSLDSMFGFGRLVYIPEDTTIIWKLGANDRHCPDCLMFAANNPYTKKTLPGYPKSGNTICLSNCYCSVIYYYNNTTLNSEYDSFLLTGKEFNVNKELPTEEQYKDLMQLRDDYYYNRLMFEKTKDRKYDNYATELKRSFYKTVRDGNLYFPINFNVKQVVTDFKLFNKNGKFKFIENSSDIDEGDFLCVFFGQNQKYVKVTKKIGTQMFVKTLDSFEYTITTSKQIIFKEV